MKRFITALFALIASNAQAYTIDDYVVFGCLRDDQMIPITLRLGDEGTVEFADIGGFSNFLVTTPSEGVYLLASDEVVARLSDGELRVLGSNNSDETYPCFRVDEAYSLALNAINEDMIDGSLELEGIIKNEIEMLRENLLREQMAHEDLRREFEAYRIEAKKGLSESAETHRAKTEICEERLTKANSAKERSLVQVTKLETEVAALTDEVGRLNRSRSTLQDWLSELQAKPECN
ncbi:hypothetical protein [Arenibacterium sp. LLYu02]|uniref:hypothetical protein n=1 Tax=Arenibacterium sp. LLYu02 TaxID=3404132 RepID=UPI003B216DA5